MRILEIETFGRGGLIHYAHNLTNALAARGHEVTLVTAAGYELAERALPPNVRVVEKIGSFSHHRGSTLSARTLNWVLKGEALRDAAAVAAFARRLGPDVIHLHCTNPISLAYLALLRLLATPVAATAHVVTPHERVPFQESVYRWNYRFCDLVVAHSEFDRRRLLHEFDVDPERVVVIPHGEYGFFETGGHGTDRQQARRRLGLGADDEVALFFGYIREYKGLDVLFEAWQSVREERPAGRLVVAGDPVRLSAARRQELESWATRLGVIHRFEYIPFSDVAGYFAAADVLVMPYRSISQSGVLYLALSLGVPVVGTRVGGLEEVLNDGDSGLLVAAESPSELARALARVLGNPDLRHRLAVGGRRIADLHSWPSIAEQTERAYSGLLRDNSGNGVVGRPVQ
jgi:glycosyltransferase involved in cell wall biosynthesis